MSARQKHSSANGLSVSQGDFKDLECTICQDLPEKKPGARLYVYSCSKAHLLCQDCLNRIQQCPVCQQNFVLTKPQRNYLPERLLDQHWMMMEQQAVSREAGSTLKSVQVRCNSAAVGSNLEREVLFIYFSLKNTLRHGS